MTYQEWKKANRSSDRSFLNAVFEFELQNPATAWAYKKRLEKEQKKRSEIMAIKDVKVRHKAISENMALFGQ